MKPTTQVTIALNNALEHAQIQQIVSKKMSMAAKRECRSGDG